MAEMIERVARAMCQLITEPGLAPEKHMATYMVLARTAIEAMREPTHDMLVAGATAQARHDHRYEIDNAEEIFSDMIDAALATTTPTSPSK
jgi:CTP synthase (UTP-ammonia lyase)